MEPRDYSEEIDFEKYWLVLKRRWLPASLVFSAVVGGSIFVAQQQPTTYSSNAELIYALDNTSAFTGIGPEESKGSFFSAKSDPLTTQAEILKSSPVAEATAKALTPKYKDNPNVSLDPEGIAGGLTVKPLTGTDILQISYTSTDPKFAADVVNTMMQTYILNNIATNRAKAVSVREFITKQLPEMEARVGRAEAALRRFREANGVVSLSQEATTTVQAMSNLDNQIIQAQGQLSQSEAKVAELRNQVGLSADSALTVSALNQATGVQTSLTELQKVQAELASNRALYRGQHPTIQQLERKEASLKALVQDRVGQVLGREATVAPGVLQVGTTKQSIIADLAKAEVERLSLANQVSVLASAQAAYLARSSSMPALEKTERDLQRQLDAAETTYKTLLTKLPEIQVAENQDVGNARIVSLAKAAEQPNGPRRTVFVAAGMGVGLLLGIAAAFLFDLADRSVKNLRETRQLFRYTLLGMIPHVQAPGKLLSFTSDEQIPKVLTRDFPHFAAQEAYQMLQANLKFLSSDKELKVITVTSSVRKEGKSTVAANLAAAIAQVNRRVLLIDADMRNPMQHHIWNLTNAAGLSNLIVNQVEFSEVVNPISPNLDVLTVGVIPPNPLTLIDSQRMKSLIEQFSQAYDVVIFDAPSIVGTADASVLSKMTDGSLLVVRPGTVNTAKGKAAKNAIAQSGQTVLGMVANDIRPKNEADSHYYYTSNEPHTVAAASSPVTRV
jgi:polysaccharide biosynthesis transport protein